MGDAFVDEIEAGVRAILANPRTWRMVEDDVRRYLVNRFPYGIRASRNGSSLAQVPESSQVEGVQG